MINTDLTRFANKLDKQKDVEYCYLDCFHCDIHHENETLSFKFNYDLITFNEVDNIWATDLIIINSENEEVYPKIETNDFFESLKHYIINNII